MNPDLVIIGISAISFVVGAYVMDGIWKSKQKKYNWIVPEEAK
jgi:ABC-type lipoprotein release transport system permease subunit